MIVVPDEFAKNTIAREGEAGRRWIAALPGLVEALCARWGLVEEGPVLHGYLGLVVPARRGAEHCILKISWIEESTTDEAAALAAWAGQGAARLLAAEPAQGALLLERLDYRRSLNDLDIAAALGVAGRLLRRLAIPAPPGFRTVPAWATAVAHNLPLRWEQYGRPLPRAWLDQARDLAIQLGGACAQGLLVNYDLHYADVLAGRREPWLAVDPKVVVGDPEFGIAQLLWTRLEDIEGQGGLAYHFDALTEAAGLDPVRARGWTLVRCADYWLWGLSVGLTHDPARCARIIAWLMEGQ